MIRGEKIALRAIEPSDTEKYHAWVNDPETNDTRGLYHPTSHEEARKWIDSQRSPDPARLTLVIEAAGRAIGFVGLRSICPRSRRAEIWIYIGDKTQWSKGYGQETVRVLCDYAFRQMNLFRIWLECNPEFTAIVRCYEKVGFTREGTLRKAYYRHGKFRDTCIMSLLREDMGFAAE